MASVRGIVQKGKNSTAVVLRVLSGTTTIECGHPKPRRNQILQVEAAPVGHPCVQARLLVSGAHVILHFHEDLTTRSLSRAKGPAYERSKWIFLCRLR